MQQAIVLVTLILLVWALYKELARPSILFLGVIAIYLICKVLTPEDILRGFSNKQIIIVFLLVILTNGIRNIFSSDFFYKWFPLNLSPKRFLLKMMLTVSSVSAFLNNTPIVAFMIPYVKEWTRQNNLDASKFMIPLSYATILGGMITVVGTSTNLVLNGLIAESHQPLLTTKDFFFLGIILSTVGILYIYFIGYKLLPYRKSKLQDFQYRLNEYMVGTQIGEESNLVGKTVKVAGLRNLKDSFLVEVIRDQKVISPVAPECVLQRGDRLFFSGSIQAIANLVKRKEGLHLINHHELQSFRHFRCMEAIIPASSSLVEVKVKESDFRNRFNASIVAIHRYGKQLPESIGNTVLNGGDMLFLLTGNTIKYDPTELIVLNSHNGQIESGKKPIKKNVAAFAGLGLLILGITGIMDLFIAVSLAVVLYILSKIISLNELKHGIDFDLVILLTSALGIGNALTQSGAADLIASYIARLSYHGLPVVVISLLFLLTTVLTAFITNAATVTLVFPIALSLASQTHIPGSALFVAIAFAASGDFMTPIGYQCNLMVMGPGNYVFKDYLRIGLPLTILYMSISIAFICFYYKIY